MSDDERRLEVTPGVVHLHRLDLWVRVVATGLHLPDQQVRWWEKALTGLRDLRLVSLDRFATFVLRTRDSVDADGQPLLFALGTALPALRLPRDSCFFMGIKEKQRGYPSAWPNSLPPAPPRRYIEIPATRDRQVVRRQASYEHRANYTVAHVRPPSRNPGKVGWSHHGAYERRVRLWVADLLKIGPNDRVLEVGFGPGVIIQHLSRLASAGYVAGVDPSREMVEQARARNAPAIQSGRVDLRQGFVEDLPFDGDSFDKALAINSMQVWPDAVAALREVRRVLKSGGRVALGFTPYSGQTNRGLTETLMDAGFTEPRAVEKAKDFCALATKP